MRRKLIIGSPVVGDIPKTEHLWHPDTIEEFAKARKKQSEFLENAERKEIGLPYDGRTFNEPTLEAFLERMLELRKMGYIFPDYVIERIKKELNELDIDKE